MTKRRWVDVAFSLALLSYPRAFRRRFGEEMRRDFASTSGTSGTPAPLAPPARLAP